MEADGNFLPIREREQAQPRVDRPPRAPPSLHLHRHGLTILLLGVFAIVTTPTDIFPKIDIPVVSVIWNYDGLSTEEMASRITTFSEYTI